MSPGKGKEGESDVAALFAEFKREMRAELRDLKKSVQHCSDTCDDVKDVTQDLKALRDELKSLVSENQKLKAENKQLTLKLQELEQYQRSNNLEIKGVPDECDPLVAVRKICELVSEPVDERDIDICHRVPTANSTTKNIVVRFVRRAKRDSILAKAKKMRIGAKDVGLVGDNSPIFVNEHLTRHNKQLLGATVAKKKELKWKFVWTAGGKVLARKDEDSRVLRISSSDDLAKMS